MAFIVRVWQIRPPEGVAHPKSRIILLSMSDAFITARGHNPTISLRITKMSKDDRRMHVLGRSTLATLAIFSFALSRLGEGWSVEHGVALTQEEVAAEFDGQRILPTPEELAGGPDSSGLRGMDGAGPRSEAPDTSSVLSASTIAREAAWAERLVEEANARAEEDRAARARAEEELAREQQERARAEEERARAVEERAREQQERARERASFRALLLQMGKTSQEADEMLLLPLP
jgi:hypothetical protein